jgi:SAM-dependent methyltransferase
MTRHASHLRVLLARLSARLSERPKPRFEPPPADGRVRLNLGCGDKLLPGYVNIDVSPSRRGVRPDVIADLRALSLPDEYAHEALAVHVIEHFYAWEAADVLREWRRVLVPGGRLVLECPNILHAAWELLADPSRARADKAGQLGMWPLYGDPSSRDPLMCHRWGYTPESLMALLDEVGFVDVRQEPALFKRREPRDMRITGRRS